jgi:hypothetical protein
MESETRLRVGRAIAKSETQAAIEAFEQLKKGRGHPHSPPPLVSDGWGGYDEAMVEVWGRCPITRGEDGLLPTSGQGRTGATYRWSSNAKTGE